MTEPPFDLAQANRWFAVELNNSVWNWLEASDYSPPQAEAMVYAAYASCYHWLQVGTPVNHQRAECLVTNALAAVGNAASALRHAHRAIGLLNEHAVEMADWDYAFAYDCLARALAAAGEKKQALAARQTARDFADKVADAEDKQIFDNWHRCGNWHGLE